MKDIWYGDKRDLVKWGGIIHLCSMKEIKNVFHVAYYRKEEWPKINFELDDILIPSEVIDHFRNIEDIYRLAERVGLKILVYKKEFIHSEREEYNRELCTQLRIIDKKKIVFLDPDIGLAPNICKEQHVKSDEVKSIWDSLKYHDYLVFYQHRFWPRSGNWIEIRKNELALSCEVDEGQVQMWSAKDIASDVVFYFIEKLPNLQKAPNSPLKGCATPCFPPSSISSKTHSILTFKILVIR